jgi:hypothetical protein
LKNALGNVNFEEEMKAMNEGRYKRAVEPENDDFDDLSLKEEKGRR